MPGRCRGAYGVQGGTRSVNWNMEGVNGGVCRGVNGGVEDVKVSNVSDRRRERPKSSSFNSFYTDV